MDTALAQGVLPMQPLSVNGQLSGSQIAADGSASEWVYTELAGLNSIRSMGNKNQSQALMQVAKQFESMLIKMMLKSMRDVNNTLNQNGLFDSHAGQMFEQLYDDQLVLSISQKGMGLADTFYQNMLREYLPEKVDKPSGPDDSLMGSQTSKVSENTAIYSDKLKDFDKVKDSNKALAVTQSVPQSLYKEASSEKNTLAEQTTQAEYIKSSTQTMAVTADTFMDKALLLKSQNETHRVVEAMQPLNSQKNWDFSTPAAFVRTLLPYAKQAADQLKVKFEGILAQAALETGWGKHLMKDSLGADNLNLFGIKADRRWQGDKLAAKTLEFEQGVPKKITAHFRRYHSLRDSFNDYVDFLQKSSRYQQALSTHSVKDFAQALQHGGYATDPHYAQKITNIVNRRDFQQWVMSAESEVL